jgi:hypothetical protein
MYPCVLQGSHQAPERFSLLFGHWAGRITPAFFGIIDWFYLLKIPLLVILDTPGIPLTKLYPSILELSNLDSNDPNLNRRATL